jgi:hypothetical protein
MADTRDPEQAEKEIELVLEEYRSLRKETTQRLSDRGTLTGFATAGAVLVVTHGATTWQYGTAAALLVVSLGVFSVRMGWAFGLLSTRLCQLEDELNALATVAYGTAPDRQLLRWEHDWQERPRLLDRLRTALELTPPIDDDAPHDNAGA